MLHRFFPPSIKVPVSQRHFGSVSKFDQEAEFERLTIYRNRATGEMSVTVDTVATLFDANGRYDTPATGLGVGEYPVQLRANNQSAVDPATGEVVFMKPDNQSQEAFEAFVDAQPGSQMLQGEYMAASMFAPVVMADELAKQVAEADQPPFSRYSGQ